MKWLSWSVVAIGCTALAACAARQAPKVEPEIQSFCAKAYADRAIDPVRAKILVPIPLNEGQPVEILANREIPSADEKPAVLALAKAFESCNDFAAGKMGSTPAYRLSSNARITDSLASLYAGEMTFGQFAKTVLYVGERDQLERQRLDEEVRQREKWRILHDHNGN